MRIYELSLHWKQGDDLAGYLETMKTPARALRAWGLSFARYKTVCESIADAVDGKAISVDADTHHIAFVPNSAAAKKVLEALAEKHLLDVVDMEDE